MFIIDKCSCAWKPRKIGQKSPTMACHQKSFFFIVFTSLVIFLSNNVGHVDSLIIKENPVRLRILEYSSKDGSLLKVLNSRYSDLVVGEEVQENSQIVLECNSLMGPLRWIYSGDGQPQHKSYYSSSSRSGSPVTYTAYLSFPNGLSAKDTGQFTCQNSYNASVSNYVYLFVPKRTVDGSLSIFVPNTKTHNLPVSNADKIARIPCVVVHPDVKVSLEKVSTSKSFYLEPPMEVPFDPKSGFTVPVTPTAKEIYTCRGEYKGEFEEVSYSTSPIKPSKPRIDPEAELLHEFLDHYLNPHANQTVGPPIAIASYPTPTPKPTTLPPLTTSQSPRLNTNVPPPEKHLTSACTPQYCGNNAECIVKDYKAYCVCLEEYTGDPKTGCHQISDHSQHLRVEDPCHPSPCGKHAECVQVNGHPLCTCLDGYFGTPPKCSANKFTNCTKNYDCEWTEYCNTETRKCDNICEGPVQFCGKGALCTAFSHMPYCTCPPGASYAGDPYDTEGLGCHVHSDRFQTEGKPSCNPSPCGRNAHCKVYSSYPLPICFCPQGFTGDPSHRCYKLSPAPIIDVFRPHFTPHPPPATSTSSTSSQLIMSPTPTSFLPPESLSDQPVLLCTPSFCGENARCRFRNNHPECHCLNGYKGDAYKGCHRTTISPTALRQACSVCGPNSVCSMISSEVRCICAPDTTGVPPNCRKPPSGSSSSVSSLSGSSPSSPSKFSSSLHNPQVSVVTSSTSALVLQHNRHQSSSSASSSFQFSHQRKSHFSCTHDLDCPDDKVCYTAIQKCLNPCSWACSDSGECSVTNHRVHCRCPIGYKGDPYIECVKIPTVSEPESESDQQQVVPQNHPCRFTCGPHTVCRRISAHEMNQLRRRAFSSRDRDPFQRSLVQYIERVNENHSRLSKNPNPRRGHYVNDDHDFTECVCMEGASGNPYSIEGCNFHDNNNNNNYSVNNNSNINYNVPAHDPSSDDLEHSYSDSNTNTIVIQTSPCRPSNPCGPHSLCVPFQGQAFCRCDYDAVGEPPKCSLRCGKEQHCLFDQVCLRGRCVPEIRRRSKSGRSNH